MNKQGSLEEEEKEVIFKIEEWLGVGDWVRMKYRFFQYLTKRSSRQLNQDDLKVVSSDPTPSGPPLFFSRFQDSLANQEESGES